MPHAAGASTRPQAHHVLVWVTAEGKARAMRVMDLESEYRPLVKELAFRAAGSDPSRGGAPWDVGASLEGVGTDAPALRVAAYPKGEGGRAEAALAAVSVPVANLGWIAAALAKTAALESGYMWYARVLGADDPILAEWSAGQADDDDFEIVSEGAGPMHLPSDFTAGEPPRGRRIIEAAPSWLRCVFRRRVWDEFLAAAEAERSAERQWIAAGRTHLGPAACWAVLEDLHELPAAEAGRHFIVTRGRELARLRERLGDRMLAHLHLHPRCVENEALAPVPSGPDATVAWNVDQVSSVPCCFPIALFGADGRAPAGDVAAHGYERGVLARIQLEVADD